jgi:hypothetical protein
LRGARLAAQLPHGLHDEEHPSHAGVAGGQPATVGVRRQRPVEPQPPALHERAALALRAEAEVFEREQHRDRERVVHLQHVDVRRRQAGAGERERAALRRGRHREVGHRRDVHVVRHRVRGTEDVHRRSREVGGALGGGEDAGRAAVGDHAAVEDVERVGDQP